jgi:hypothetical protein
MRFGLALAVAMGIAVAAWRLGLAQAPLLADVEPLELTLDGVRYGMLVPKGLRVTNDVGGCPMLRHPSTRLVKFIVLYPASGSIPTAFPRRETLPNGARVAYTVDRQLDGPSGSGGPEGELKGRMELNGRTIAVTCHDQDEWGARPEWCLRHLGSLQAKGARPGSN